MQITLIQVEIEEAIRRFVESQINVREGMRIDIELKATRGAEGYQAYIDIVEQDAERKIGNGDSVELEPEAPVAPAPTKPAATATKTAAVRTTTRRTNPPVPAEPPVQTAPEEPEESIVDQPDAEAVDPGDDVVGASEDTVAAPPAAPTRSLFGGLTKPSNG